MNGTTDFTLVAQAALAAFRSLLNSWLPGGVYSGDEYSVRNPLRQDDHPGSFKINVSTGAWADFAVAGAQGGDPISLYAYLNSISQFEALKQLQVILGAGPVPTSTQAPSAGEAPNLEWKLISPVPPDAPPVPTHRNKKIKEEWQHYQITHYWPYHSPIGELLFYVVRYETPEGKETPQMTLMRSAAGVLKWKFKGVEGPRPLYNLDKIAHSPEAQIILVEGEKKADAIQALIETNNLAAQMVAVTWCGGARAIAKTDWTAVRGRKVLLWPDNDKPGLQAMTDAMAVIGLKSQFLMLKIPDDKPKAWDAADAILVDGWSMQQVIEFVKQTRFRPEPPATEQDPGPAAGYEDPPPGEPVDLSEMPFRCLGYNGDFCYYLPAGTRQVMAIRRNQHGAGDMRALAPQRYWEANFPGPNGVAWASAGNSLLRICEKVGVYMPTRQRGRGAWLDNGRSILHLGDRIIVDGKDTPLFAFQSRFSYDAAEPIEQINAPPLDKHKAHELLDIINMLFWTKPFYARLFAGWCVNAVICGALKHRPHLWLTSKPGCGKSWIIDELLTPILGGFVVPLASTVTEPGIRQTLCNDALAVIIDEFEGHDKFAKEKIQNILHLARMSFSDTHARIVKGGQNQKPTFFQIRSCFFMSSVGVNVEEHADETRISIISLEKPFDRDGLTKDQHFDLLCKKTEDLITQEFCSAFRMRAIKLIPVIRKNAETFERAVGHKIGNRRSGDQLGALLAGAFSLCSDGHISSAQAAKWAAEQDWTEQQEIAGKSDEKECLNIISTAQLVTDTQKRRSVAQLLRVCSNVVTFQESEEKIEENIAKDDAELTLRRSGIKLKGANEDVFVAMGHPAIKEILKNMPYGNDYGRLLQRLSPLIVTHNPTPFAGKNFRALVIPWKAFFEEGS